MLDDRSYNLPSNQGDANAGHDRFKRADRAALVPICRDVTRGWARNQTFCSALQFGDWCDLLQSEGEGEAKPGTEGVGWSDFEVEPV